MIPDVNEIHCSWPTAVEAPAGVGFSYSDTPAVDYVTDDNKTALDNYHFLVNWFSNFSEYKDHDFYIRLLVSTDIKFC